MSRSYKQIARQLEWQQRRERRYLTKDNCRKDKWDLSYNGYNLVKEKELTKSQKRLRDETDLFHWFTQFIRGEESPLNKEYLDVNTIKTYIKYAFKEEKPQ